jgi:GNAT superfamily N-acetyltransferase
VRSESELVSAANENFVASYRKLVEHCLDGETRVVGGVFAFVTGLPFSLFNGCVVVEPTTPEELAAALDWVGGRVVRHRAWIAAELVPGLAHVPAAYGLEREPEPYPGMVLHPLPAPPAPSIGVTVVPVAEAGLDEYLRVCIEGGAAPDVARRMFSPAFARDPDVRLFIGRLQGRAVGTSVAIRSRAASGVVAVGTLASARRRGVGTSLTSAAVEAGRAWGRDTIVLQSSAMGLSMYAAMGFRTVAPYTTFSQPPATETVTD